MLTPVKAIRAKCIDCCCGSFKEVEFCTIERCDLHPYRFGKNPNIKRECTPAMRMAAEKARLSKKNLAQTIVQTANPTVEGKDTTPEVFTESPVEST